MGKVLYNVIGKGYNQTRQADPHIFERLRHLMSPDRGKLYLDIGCGTGNYTAAFAERGFDFWGVDPSEEMLNEARKKSDRVKWVQGTADNIPVDNHTFDGAIATLTVHHWTDLEASFRELFRVMKYGARLVIFTAAPEQMYTYWLNSYFPEMITRSQKQMPKIQLLDSITMQLGFLMNGAEKYFVTPDLKDHFLYCGKHDPEKYFDPVIRNGISSFANLADPEEVEKGLKKLRKDIDSGMLEKLKGTYSANAGDYVFLTVEKMKAPIKAVK